MHGGFLKLIIQFFNAIGTNVPAFVADNVSHAVTKYAGCLIFAEYNAVTLNINLQCVLFRNIKGAAHFNGQNNAPQLINLADNSC